jgi:hypothetical protein
MHSPFKLTTAYRNVLLAFESDGVEFGRLLVQDPDILVQS